MKGFRLKKKKEREEEALRQAFLRDYAELVKKHQIDFGLYLDISNKGIRPIARPIKVNYPPTNVPSQNNQQSADIIG